LEKALLRWYVRAARDLPWRKTRDPYAIWLSETMLQQTRVEAVVGYYERFLRELPTCRSLAEAPLERVLALWSGLGYYRRARMLHAAARQLADERGGRLPEDPAELRRLEGVGAYTAGAIASIAFGRRVPVVDGNVARVLARIFAVRDDVKAARGSERLWRLAGQLVSRVEGEPGDWNQALMELGATVCLPREPKCSECPVRAACRAHARGLTGQLPRIAKKRPPRVARLVAVVLASGRSILLARRRPNVLFGGLWEAPTSGAGIEDLAARLAIDPRALTEVGRIEHVLSHRRLEVEVLRGALSRRRTWGLPGPEYDAIEAVPLARLADRAQATLTRKVLSVANVPAAGLRSP
jgi:A/G-specific adenine glycosylase